MRLHLFRQAWKLGPALATGNVVVMKVIAIVVLRPWPARWMIFTTIGS